MSTIKSRRVFQLKKTSTVRPKPDESDKQKSVNIEPEVINNNSYASNMSKQEILNNNSQLSRKTDKMNINQPERIEQPEKAWVSLVDGPELILTTNQIYFKEKVNTIQVKNLSIKNVGSSSIYYELSFKNKPKISTSAIKDPKPKFQCHYQPSVILPGQTLTFSFSFISQIPGVYIEQCQVICRPSTNTHLLPIKLKGEAYINDKFLQKRKAFKQKLFAKTQYKLVNEIVKDVIHEVKSPESPLPDVTDMSIAETLFEQKNWNKGLYFNQKVHGWFDRLYREAYAQNHGEQEAKTVYWDQSVETIRDAIMKVSDDILRQSYLLRYDNYSYLSATPPKATNKNQLFDTIKGFLLETGFKVGGDLTDEVKKELEMWEIPFEEPKEEETEEEIKARKQEQGKVKAEWAKKMKKKKWGEQQEKELMTTYKDKAVQKIKCDLAERFVNFGDKADLIKAKSKLSKEINYKKHFGFLSRLKSVHEYKVEGKKIFLKFNLKLKDNPEQKLKQLEDYLIKKREEELRLEEEKRNSESTKKKKQSIAKKKKGQKQEEQIKPVVFDFQSLLDTEAWDGVMETLKLLVEKQPYLLVIGCNYGPRKGKEDPKFSVKFLLEHMRKVEPAIQFLPHLDLFELEEKINEQQINEGSIYFTQNLNFLPSQVMQEQITKELQPATEQKQAVIATSTQMLLMSQINRSLRKIQPCFELIITQDKSSNISGITTFSKCEKILGIYNWKFIAMSLRVQGSTFIMGGDFDATRLVLLSRLLHCCSKIYLTGKIGLKFYIAKTKSDLSLLNCTISQSEKNAILSFIQIAENKSQGHKLVIPEDFIVCEEEQVNNQGQQAPEINYKASLYNPESQYSEKSKFIDIGPKTLENILGVTENPEGQVHLYIVKRSEIGQSKTQDTPSFTSLCRALYQKQEAKKQRHQKQANTAIGINYQNQVINYFIGIKEEEVQALELVPKKIKQADENQNEEPEEEQAEQDEENQMKKIDMVADFKVQDSTALQKLLLCQFDPVLKDVDRYIKSD